MSTKQLASSTLRATLGAKELIQIFTEKDTISTEILTTLDSATESWGIKVCFRFPVSIVLHAFLNR